MEYLIQLLSIAIEDVNIINRGSDMCFRHIRFMIQVLENWKIIKEFHFIVFCPSFPMKTERV